jgi:ribosomal protein S20
MHWIDIKKRLPNSVIKTKVRTASLKEYKAVFFPKSDTNKQSFKIWDTGNEIKNVTHWYEN